MAISKIKVGGLADDSVTATNIDDDGTGYTLGDLTLGSGGTNWSLPTARGTDKYVLQIANATGVASWEESLTAPEVQSVSNMKINQYETPYSYTGTTTASSTTISSLSSDTGVLVGQYISGAGIPTNTTIASITNSTTIVISNAATASASSVALSIQKTPGEKNGGSVTIAGTNFGTDVGDLSVAISTSGGSIIANASFLTSLSGGTSVTAEWVGSEGTYNEHLNSAHGSYIGDSGNIYFKITKAGLASNVLNSSTTLTADPTLPNSGVPTQTGGDVTTAPTASSLGVYGGAPSGAGEVQSSDTLYCFNFDRAYGDDVEDTSNIEGNGVRIANVAGNAVIKSSPFGDGKSAIYFPGDSYFRVAANSAFRTTGDFTLEFWIRSQSDNQDKEILDMRGGTSGTESFNLRFKTGGLRIIAGGSETTFDDSTPYNIRGFVHTAVVRLSGVVYVYFDGKKSPETLSTTQATCATDAALSFATGYAVSDTGTFYIDEIRYTVGVAVYTSNFNVPTSRLSTTQSAGTNIAAITGTQCKLLIHSNIAAQATAKASYGTSKASWATNNDTLNFASAEGQSIWWQIDFGAGVSYHIRRINYEVYNHSSSYNHSGTCYIKGSNNGVDFTTIYTSSTGPNGGFPVTGTPVNLDIASNAAYRYIRLESPGTANAYPLRELIFYTHDGSNYVIVPRASLDQHSFTDSSSLNSGFTLGGNSQALPFHAGAQIKHVDTAADYSFGHGGIEPAMAWPASGKIYGSNGMFFDGENDYLQANTIPAIGTGDVTVDFWMYPLTQNQSGNDSDKIFYAATNFFLSMHKTNRTIRMYDAVDTSDDATFNGSALTLNTWTHIAMERYNGTVRLFINGTASSTTFTNNTSAWNNTEHLIGIIHTGDNNHAWKGFIDTVMLTKNARYEGTNFTVPTRISIPDPVGAANPDVGTITLSATSTTAIDFSSIGTALPAGLTLAEGTDDGNTRKATITGAFTGTVSSDTSTQNILIKGQDPSDAARAITFNGTTGMGITRNAAGNRVVFNARRFMGYIEGSTRSISGFGFRPDFVWMKRRDGIDYHQLFDSLRGATNRIYTNSNGAQATTAGTLTSFDSDGYTLGSQSNVNTAGAKYISFGWKAGGVPSANYKRRTDGSSSETSLTAGTGADQYTSGYQEVRQSVNSTGQFSITKYQAPADTEPSSPFPTFSLPHGLTGQPDMIWVKKTSGTGDWAVWHKKLSNEATSYLYLSTNIAAATATDIWASAAPTATHVNLRHNGPTLYSGGSYIMYCWKAVAGVSAFGTFNSSTSAYSVTTTDNGTTAIGFSPKYVIFKQINAANDWMIYDTFRAAATNWEEPLNANNNNSESDNSNSGDVCRLGKDQSGGAIDGFSIKAGNRDKAGGGTGNSYIFAAFA